MTLFGIWIRLLCLGAIGLWLGGCTPMANTPADEEKDPHFLTGKNRVNNMDYEGAIEAFEHALNSNPRSAAAHLELGLLCDEKKGDQAAAIYHYKRHLALRPNSNMAETLKQRIYSCKVELARSVSFALVSRQVQDDIRRLHSTNSILHEEIQQLKAQLVEQAAMFSNKLAAAQQAASLPSPDVPPDTDPGPQPRPPAAERRPTVAERGPRVNERQNPHAIVKPMPRSYTTPPRTHVVRAGETMATISRKYNIKLSALQFANPAVDARKLRPGQVLILPAR